MSKRKTKNIKMSLYLPEAHIKALELIRVKERVLKSHQVEFGLNLYFKKYEDFLKQKGIDLWQE